MQELFRGFSVETGFFSQYFSSPQRESGTPQSAASRPKRFKSQPRTRRTPQHNRKISRSTTTTEAPTGVLSRYEPVRPTQKPSTDSTPASTTTPRKLFHSRMAVSAGKITSEEISMAPIIRIPSTMVKAVSTDSRVLYSLTFTPVAREKFSSKVMAKSRW